MRTPSRRTAVILVLAIVVVANGVIAWQRYTNRHRLELGVPAQRRRIDNIIETLRSETFEESVARLSDELSYAYPGYHSPRKFDQVSFEVMLSNRRCIKVVDDLRQMPESIQDSECRRIFDMLFREHSDAMLATLHRLEDPMAPPVTKSVYGTRMALCAVLFASASHGSVDTLLMQLAKFKSFQGDINSKCQQIQDPKRRKLAIMTAREYGVPDARLEFNVLCLRALRTGDNQLLKAVKRITSGLETTEIPIVHWTANTTWFDVPRRMEGIPMDTAKGVVTYMLYGWPEKLRHDQKAQQSLIDEISAALAARSEALSAL